MAQSQQQNESSKKSISAEDGVGSTNSWQVVDSDKSNNNVSNVSPLIQSQYIQTKPQQIAQPVQEQPVQ